MCWKDGSAGKKAHVALPDVLPLVSSTHAGQPTSGGPNALFVHLSTSGLTCTYPHRDKDIHTHCFKKYILKKTHTHIWRARFFHRAFKDPLQLCTNLLAAKSRSRALNGNREIVLLVYVNMIQVSIIREEDLKNASPKLKLSCRQTEGHLFNYRLIGEGTPLG